MKMIRSIVTVLIMIVLVFIAAVLLAVRVFPDKLPGISWTRIQTIPSGRITSLAVISEKEKSWWLAAIRSDPEHRSGIYRSSDRGRTWQSVGEQLASCPEITSLQPFTQRPGYVALSSFGGESAKGGVWISADSGATWQNRSAGLPNDDVRLVLTAGDSVYAGMVTGGIAVSQDFGVAWQPLVQGLTDLRVQTICVDPRQPQRLLCGTLRGLFRSEDRGGAWQAAAKGFIHEAPFILDIAGDPHHADHFFALERTGGDRTDCYRSSDGGLSWNLMDSGMPTEFHPRCILIDAFRPNHLLLGTVYDGVYESIDGGASWRAQNFGIPLDHPMIIHQLVQESGATPQLYAVPDTPKLFFSRPAGQTVWQYLVDRFSGVY